MPRQYRKVTDADRKVIAQMYEENVPIYRIANAIDRPVAFVSQELMRGMTDKVYLNGRQVYDPEVAKRRLHENIHRRGAKPSQAPALDGQKSLYDKESNR